MDDQPGQRRSQVLIWFVIGIAVVFWIGFFFLLLASSAVTGWQ